MKAFLKPYNLLRIAAVGALAGLLLMVAAFVFPGHVPLILFMSAGQGLGTLSLALYLAVVLWDLRRVGVLHYEVEPDDDAKADDRAGDEGA